jgi:hypothetical protein
MPLFSDNKRKEDIYPQRFAGVITQCPGSFGVLCCSKKRKGRKMFIPNTVTLMMPWFLPTKSGGLLTSQMYIPLSAGCMWDIVIDAFPGLVDATIRSLNFPMAEAWPPSE